MDFVVLANKYKKQHFAPLEDYFAGRYTYVESYRYADIIEYSPELVLCFDEHYGELGNVIGHLKREGVATLQMMDGILEWRRTWEYRREDHAVDGVANPLNQPAFSHKIACLGRRDARILESWGNFGKCEIVGAPRFDKIVCRRISGEFAQKTKNSRPVILVMTAKTPGFTPEQVRITKNALLDLHNYFASRPDIDVVWRVTGGLEKELEIQNHLSDLLGAELHAVLAKVDAVITTASTAMLEAMLFNRPVALLDYHNTPHYFEAAWTISCQEHIAQVVDDLISPPKPRFDYQNFLLEEQLACRTTAKERLISLIETMLEIKKSGGVFEAKIPQRILQDQDLFFCTPLSLTKLKEYYPQLPVPEDINTRELQLELSAARGTIKILYEKIAFLELRLMSIPGYRLLRAFKAKLQR